MNAALRRPLCPGRRHDLGGVPVAGGERGGRGADQGVDRGACEFGDAPPLLSSPGDVGLADLAALLDGYGSTCPWRASRIDRRPDDSTVPGRLFALFLALEDLIQHPPQPRAGPLEPLLNREDR